MRKYGRRARPGRRGGLVISKYEEYVHDCEIDCPDGHVRWPNAVLRATEVTMLVPFGHEGALRFPWDFGRGRL